MAENRKAVVSQFECPAKLGELYTCVPELGLCEAIHGKSFTTFTYPANLIPL